MTFMRMRAGECDACYVARLRRRAEILGCKIEVGEPAPDGRRSVTRVWPGGRRVNIASVDSAARFDGGCMCSRPPIGGAK